MAVIFYFSAQSDPLAFVGPALDSAVLVHLIHAAEYFGLMILLWRALYAHQRVAMVGRRLSAKGARLSILVGLGYALFDELHQEIVRWRSFELADLGYDLMGMAAALVLIWFWSEIRRPNLLRTH